ncbi:oxaloacetate decarboxylase, gamma subunit [Maridesulfovibrio ferrireducens]|uniref:Oxaloacetate decarboxylase, gamma subunit n=1 Tax=Maridesulfovibrio ferrireducens TaxID=246191 RepID=A0A1G9G3M3_9BACT|nr:OadG family protein [Maridesulfovibrio ferrireducens]SDK94883.1 oxaloacetate decarboxylase, gamma subunit [Maridesulfovibrio ferrireducens]
MQEMVFSWQHVVNGNGLAISITGMGIVFVALMLVSLYIAMLPRLAGFFNKIIPPAAHHCGMEPAPSGPVEAEIVAAAVAYLHKNKS